jgi:extracellular factor (EF) 3-hydroxypalmitic acid methyl ester biosynthesis protein
MFGPESAGSSSSLDQLVPNLDHFASSLKSGGERLGVVEELIALLAATYDDALERNELSQFRQICQTHALHKSLLEDPFTRRAFEKPRGYAGDAVMLDYIYRPQELRASEIGRALHRATTTAGSAQSIRWRRSRLADSILEHMESRPRVRVLSVASGHLRELDIVNAMISRRNLEIVALDQDKESLDEAVRSYRQFDIQPLNRSISYLFKPNALGSFDLIYSAGLFDYLTDRTAISLIEALVAKLRPDGRLILGNYTPSSDGRGYMEGMMDWRLIYRSEHDLMRLASVAAAGRSLRTYLDKPRNIAYIEIGDVD